MAMLNLNDFTAAASLFPIKLYRMVSDTQCHCMTWGGEGEHLVLNTRLFEDELLQQTLARWKYQLKTTSTTSFIRQLHAYGFRKVIEGYGEPNNIRRYYHPYFHRQRPDLLMFMKRSMRSGAAKKHPLRIFEESTRQAVPGNPCPVNSSRPLTAYDQIGPSSLMLSSSQQMSLGELSRCQTETPNKRRRKAQPRRHPSFKDDCDNDEDEDFSPPSLVTQLRFRGDDNIASKYPDLALENSIMRSPVTVKTEPPDELKTLQDYYPTNTPKLNATPQENKKTKESHTEQQRVESGRNDIEKNKGIIKEQKSLACAPPLPSIPVNMGNGPVMWPISIPPPPNPRNTVVIGKRDPPVGGNTDEPLDLSTPITSRKPATQTEKLEVAQPDFQFQQVKMKPMAILNGNNTPNFPQNDLNVRPQLPPAAAQQQQQPQTFLISSQTPLHHPGSVTNGSMPVPPFPTNNTRINVPPHSVLQPAYIAWPTRGIFCPQTKQFIQSRPTIIPLPFKGQQISPGKHANSRPGMNFLPQQWNNDTLRLAQNPKDQVPKPATTREEPAYHLRSMPRPKALF